MSSSYSRTSATMFGLATLLLSGFGRAQEPTNAAPSVATAGPSTEPAPTATTAIPVTPANATSAATQSNIEASHAAPVQNALPASVSPHTDDEPQTLFSSKSQWGGYGGLDVAYTRLVGKDAALLCGGGALLVDHQFSLGLVGCGNASQISGQGYGDVVHENGDRLEFGYGGLVLGYQLFPRRIYNLLLSAMVGGGATAIVNRNDRWDNDNWRDHDNVKTHDALFVAEPRLTGYVNLTRWARMGAFAGYRFVSGVNMANMSSSDLSGPVVGGTLQFGWF